MKKPTKNDSGFIMKCLIKILLVIFLTTPLITNAQSKKSSRFKSHIKLGGGYNGMLIILIPGINLSANINILNTPKFQLNLQSKSYMQLSAPIIGHSISLQTRFKLTEKWGLHLGYGLENQKVFDSKYSQKENRFFTNRIELGLNLYDGKLHRYDVYLASSSNQDLPWHLITGGLIYYLW